jgi:hypothetical protein
MVIGPREVVALLPPDEDPPDPPHAASMLAIASAAATMMIDRFIAHLLCNENHEPDAGLASHAVHPFFDRLSHHLHGRPLQSHG